MSLSQAQSKPKRRRRGRTALVVTVIFLLLVGLGAVLADSAARGIAEDQIEQQLASIAPAQAHIGGFSFLAQLLSGRLDQVELEMPGVPMASVTVDATVVATGVPLDRSQPVDRLTGRFVLDQDALNALSGTLPNSPSLTLGAGVIESHGQVAILAQSVRYRIQLQPRVDDGYLILTPTKVIVDENPGIDLAKYLGDLGKYGMSLCLAQYLPAQITMTDVAVSPGGLRIDASGKSVPLSRATLSERGSCQPR